MKWTTRDGKTRNIKDLETNHLENMLKLLKRNNGKEYPMCYGHPADFDAFDCDMEVVDNDEKIEKVEMELRLRKLENLL